jgi:hypothetical protein
MTDGSPINLLDARLLLTLALNAVILLECLFGLEGEAPADEARSLKSRGRGSEPITHPCP